MIFVEVDPVMMHATSITPASWVLPVLADAAAAMTHIARSFWVFLSLDGMLAGQRKKGGVCEISRAADDGGGAKRLRRKMF